MVFSGTWRLNEKPWNISFQQCFSKGSKSQRVVEGDADESMKQSGDALREREIQEDNTWSMQALKKTLSLLCVQSHRLV
jgi:hypothetical protein